MTQVEAYWPLGFGLLLIAGFGSWVFIHSNRSYLLRWAVIPISLMVAVASAKVYDARLGYAVAAQLPPKFIYLGHQVVVEKNRKAGLEVWTREAATRLYRIGYSKPMEQALDRAHEQARSGLPVVMHRSQGGAPSNAKAGDAGVEGYESNVVLPAEINPKGQAIYSQR